MMTIKLFTEVKAKYKNSDRDISLIGRVLAPPERVWPQTHSGMSL